MLIVAIPVHFFCFINLHAGGACFVPFPWHPGYMQGNRGTVTLQWQPWTAGGFPAASELLREPQTLQQTSCAAAEMPGTSQSWRRGGGVEGVKEKSCTISLCDLMRVCLHSGQ